MKYQIKTTLEKAWKQLKEIEKIFGTDKVKYIKDILYKMEEERNNE